MKRYLLINANAVRIPLADNSVHMVACSPPYFSIRQYKTEANKDQEIGTELVHDCLGWATGKPCGECYVCAMVTVFREVKRVLRPDGICFINLGDSYAGSGGAGGDYATGGLKAGQPKYKGTSKYKNLPDKNLMGIPWRVALALQADGWILRQDIIWSKPNPMPESVLDRCTKSHEYIFVLAKSKKYFFDGEAIKEPLAEASLGRAARKQKLINKTGKGTLGKQSENGVDTQHGYAGLALARNGKTGYNLENGTRNKRSVWHVATRPYKGAHFATYPPTLVEPMIKAGTSEKGCCPQCGAPWQRVLEKNQTNKSNEAGITEMIAKGVPRQKANLYVTKERGTTKTIAWKPGCKCGDLSPKPCLVLDPFAGSGTTLMVAVELGRYGIGLDLSSAYLHEQAEKRVGRAQPKLF